MAAVGLERISRVVGYTILKGDFATTSPNLPQRIVILSEANTANQATLEDKIITSAQQAGVAYGFGSPIYHIMRILQPAQGGGTGGIPVQVYPQTEPVGAAAKVLEITPVGVATGNGTHQLKVAGRTGIDAEFYDINIVVGDTVADITGKISDAINNVLGCPMTATSTDYLATLTSKWKGLTADEITVTVVTNDNDLGLSYGIASTANGSGTPTIAAALAKFSNTWNTIVVNGYSTNTSIMAALEAFNGIPDPENPTGRYVGIVFKPFIALTGSVVDDPSTITDTRLNDVTIAICPAPLSTGFTFEAAANMTALFAPKSQNTPELDVGGSSYPDMPVPSDGVIGSMATYNNRDAFVKKGCSTVDLISDRYEVQDFVTTYHKLGETPPQYRYCRNLMLDFNVRYGYFLLEQINVVDHVLVDDDDTVVVDKKVSPKQWKAILFTYADDLTLRGLIAQPAFMKESITVTISTVNPDRLEVSFSYKRTGTVRISATEAKAGFNFGTLT